MNNIARQISRKDSKQFIGPGEGNPNVDWMSGKGVWTLYLLIILAARGALGLVFSSWTTETLWTVTSIVHCIITWGALHWALGVPYATGMMQQGKFDQLTSWEQLDLELYHTPTRKFLTIVPIALFMITMHSADWANMSLLLINLAACLLLVVSKLPLMHGVRVFGINARP